MQQSKSNLQPKQNSGGIQMVSDAYKNSVTKLDNTNDFLQVRTNNSFAR